MVVSCVRLFLVALLVLAPPVHGWLENTSDAADGQSKVAMSGTGKGTNHQKENGTKRAHLMHRCHHLMCSNSYLTRDAFVLSQPGECDRAVLHLVAGKLFTTVLDHDPPIPKRPRESSGSV